MKDSFVERMMSTLRNKVDDRLTHEIQIFPAGKVLYIRYGKFVLEKVQLKYLRFIARTEDDLWQQYIMPLRRRLSTIRNPIEWRIGRETDITSKKIG